MTDLKVARKTRHEGMIYRKHESYHVVVVGCLTALMLARHEMRHTGATPRANRRPAGAGG